MHGGEPAPDIDRDSAVPIYVQLADHVESLISSGIWVPGRRLPAERELAAEWGVAYMTVRRMMAELRERGRITTQIGKGNYIRE